MPIPTKHQTRLKCLRDSGLADKKPEVFGGIRWGSVGFSQVVVRFHFVQNSSQNKTWRQDKHTWSKPPTQKKNISFKEKQGIRNQITTFVDLHPPNFPSLPILGGHDFPPPTFAGQFESWESFRANISCDKNENIQNLWSHDLVFSCLFQHHVVEFSSTWHFLWHTVPIISAVGLQ